MKGTVILDFGNLEVSGYYSSSEPEMFEINKNRSFGHRHNRRT